MEYINNNVYKIHSRSVRGTGGGILNYSITVPEEIAKKLSNDTEFVCELTEDGILFSPVKVEIQKVVVKVKLNL